MKTDDDQPTPEERRLRLEETRLALENSFAKKWLPTLATVIIGLIAGMFGYVQHQGSIEETKRARIESKAKDEREWGFKVIEMYFNKRELFDLTKNAETAVPNLRVLAAVAPAAVQGVLNAEQSRIPPPSGSDDTIRLDRLAAVAGVQDALAGAARSTGKPDAGFKPSDFTVYVQYPKDEQEIALKTQGELAKRGYRVPGIEKVGTVPSRLEVRYYRAEQKSFASDLVTELGKTIGLPAGPENAILVKRSKELPGGILEVWLPRLAK